MKNYHSAMINSNYPVLKKHAGDRGRRDTTQQYVGDEIQPTLDNLTIFSTTMELLYQTLLSQPLKDMSQFVQAVVGRTDIVGFVNKNVIL